MKDIAVFFDLDKTMLYTSSSVALSKAYIETKVIGRWKTFLSILIQLEYLLFGVGHKKLEKITNRLAALNAGINVVILEKVTECSFGKYVYPKCNRQMLKELYSHKSLGHKTILASASILPIVRPIANKLGMDYYLATYIEIKNDLFEGKINTFMYADQKADSARELAQKNGWDLNKSFAYSDSITDLPLLELVGNPIAVNPDSQLRKIAIDRGWKIIDSAKSYAKQKSGKKGIEVYKKYSRGFKFLLLSIAVGTLITAIKYLCKR